MNRKPDIYAFYNSKNLSFLRARLSRVTQLLHYGWGDGPANGEKTGFGGLKWAECGAALVPLFNTIHDVLVAPTVESAQAMVSALNIAINQAHNGGWWLNKFASVSAYT